MQRVRPLMFVVLCGFWASGASGQARQDFEKCREIGEDRLRLECYDAISLNPGRATRSKYETVELGELEDFPLSYRGRLVEVTGWLAPSAGLLLLKTAADAADALPIDAEALSRRQLEEIRNICGSGCRAMVQGKVAPVDFTTGILADRVLPE